ncbi:sigma-70 family RNA polymerase sigma factor [Oceanibium sediminis]|uniref:sigma-70 family RNA polymerase sigma factor n=1 Tax=Oceanibium sediminis TaxID=2026339 RepID=UPI000DD4E9CD|nr:sigma-70 family RNA polymerase sigma factor [Oceanibium sediminis]
MMASDPSERQADAALLAAYAAGDAEAARQLARTHGPPVFRLARRLLNNDAEAEEIAQEAMMRLWKIAPDWRAGEALISTWLYRVATNLCTDRLRRVRPGPLPEGHDPADESPSVAERLHTRQRAAALEAALETLPDRQRVAITLRHLEERSNPEIAEVMDISVEAVESLLSRGRRALKAALAPAAPHLSVKDA